LAPVVSLYSSEDTVPSSPSAPNTEIQTETQRDFRIPDAFGSNALGGAIKQQLLKSPSLNNLLARKSDGDIQLPKPSSKQLLVSLPNRNTVSAASSCGHHGAGQELCYLCHQRSKRNIPIYLQEEKRHKEAEEQQLLQQYQHLKDTEKQLKDEANENLRREERAKMDAFNIGIAEAIRNRKAERPKSTDIGVSE
jgi:flagellar motor protein MotB